MERVNCIIIDDEPLAQEVLERYLVTLPHFHLIAKVSNPLLALPYFSTVAIDLVFLDIQMPKMNGIQFIHSLTAKPKIILTTAYKEFAVEGFELDVLDYLLKPISFERFIKAINKYDPPQKKETFQSLLTSTEQKIQEESPCIFVMSDRKHVRVALNHILYLESQGEYIKIITIDGEIRTLMKLGHMESLLPSNQFIRTHRSFIVRVDKIKAFTNEFAEVGTIQIPVGRSYKREFLAKMLSGN